MNYQQIYNRLINKAQSRKKPDCYIEEHHIIPKCLGGSNDSSNLVFLTAREHCFAHLILAKIHGGVLWTAVLMMTDKFKMTSRAYSVAREKYAALRSKAMTGENNPMFGVSLSGNKNGMYGKGHLLAKQKNGRFISSIIATKIDSGEKLVFTGKQELIDFGFSDTKVYACLNGRRKTHKGHTFERP